METNLQMNSFVETHSLVYVLLINNSHWLVYAHTYTCVRNINFKKEQGNKMDVGGLSQSTRQLPLTTINKPK